MKKIIPLLIVVLILGEEDVRHQRRNPDISPG